MPYTIESHRVAINPSRPRNPGEKRANERQRFICTTANDMLLQVSRESVDCFKITVNVISGDEYMNLLKQGVYKKVHHGPGPAPKVKPRKRKRNVMVPTSN